MFDHAYSPGFEVDRGAFRSLKESVVVLIRLDVVLRSGCAVLTYSSLGVGRSAGSFNKHFAIMSSKIEGKASLLGNFGEGSRTICCKRSRIPCGPPASSSSALPAKGNLPMASSINVSPTLQTSDLTVYGDPCIRSGAMYVPVPTKVSAMDPSSSLDTPKSHNLILPFEFTRMLEGFKSRCMMRWAL